MANTPETTERIGIKSLAELKEEIKESYPLADRAHIRQSPTYLLMCNSIQHSTPVEFVIKPHGSSDEQTITCYVKLVGTTETTTLPYQVGLSRTSYLVQGHTKAGRQFLAACSPDGLEGLMLLE